MQGVRVENEIKMYASGGPFAYDGNDPSVAFSHLLTVCSEAGFRCEEPKVLGHTDYYYGDRDGIFDRDGILLRYRDMGSKAFLTMKMPNIVSGMGLSRREIEGEIINDSRFDRWNSVQGYCNEVYGRVEIARTPKLVAEVIRAESRIRSKSKFYSFTFDKLVYIDPVSGRRSVPCYELEFEMLDQAIQDDTQMSRLISILEERYLFEEERISKYARGMAFVRSLKR